MPVVHSIVSVVTLAAMASAPEAALSNLPGADFAPGSLRLPLTVHERSGVARRGAVVTSGVPFPPGFLADCGRLRVVDAAGRPAIAQAVTMVKWHKPVYDDSVQWALVSFLCDVAANGTSTYYLTDGGAAAPSASPLKVTKDAAAITVETGAAKFVLPLSGEALIASGAVGGKEVIAGKGLRGTITSGDWPERNLKTGDLHAAVHEPSGVVIEEAGPARAVVCIKGIHTPGDKDVKFYEFTARLYFDVNSPAVRVIYTIANNRVDPKLIDGWRRIYTWPIEDASLLVDFPDRGFGEQTKTVTLVEDKTVSSDKGLTVYQDSSGGEKWQNLGGGNYENWLGGYTKGQTVRGVTFRGYKVSEGQAEVAAGKGHLGVMDVSSKGVGLTAALRNFRLEYPHTLEVSNKTVRLSDASRREVWWHAESTTLRVGLFPGEFSEPFHLNNGQRKSWDIRLTLHGAAAPDLKEAHAVQDALLLFRPAPAWMVRAGAAGAWPYGIALAQAPGRQPALRRDTSKLDGIQAGWDWYGWISSWNAGGGHWNEETVFLPWVLWGDGANFDDAECRTLWSADLTAINYDDPDIPALWLWLMDWNDHEPRIRRERYPAWYNRDTWGLPDSGHMGMLMWPEYYYLTGDMRAREAVEHLGNRARAMLWKHNYDDRADGTGPMKTAVNWCKKADPDGDPDFRLATRYTGWPLFDLANAYRLSGDPQVLAECRTVALGFRNTGRYSPTGFLVLQVNPKGSREVYGGQGPFEEYRDLSASQCYAHFQEGLMVTGLIEYYLMSRDIEALDTMVGFADFVCHHAMLRDPAGKRRGWTYAFGDYWGPYTWDDAGGKGATFHVSNFTVTEGLGWITRFTGRQDYLEVLADATASPGGGFNEAAALQAVLHPPLDRTPPAAVSDLKAEAAGQGRVTLTWTAPGDDGTTGTAQRYQVKYAAVPIVERVEGWPDRSPPLPATRAEWEAKVKAFQAKHIAYWQALNAKVEAAPKPAGTREQLTVEGLKPGRYWFALKAFDEAPNLSGLSNVVAVEVK